MLHKSSKKLYKFGEAFEKRNYTQKPIRSNGKDQGSDSFGYPHSRHRYIVMLQT